MAPTLHRLGAADVAGFAALVNDVHGEFGFAHDPVLDADLTDPLAHYRHVWVLKRGHDVVGSVALTASNNGSMTLKRMYLRPEFRGVGWGYCMLQTAIEMARVDGCGSIVLDTTERQDAAIRGYKRAGFAVTSRDGDTIVMELRLSG